MLVKTKRGDTIVEAVFAFAIFGFIAVSSLLIMRQGMAKTQTAQEINLVRAQINAQAEALRYIHSSALSDYASDNTSSDIYKKWEEITDYVTTDTPEPSAKLIQGAICTPIATVNPRAFVLNPRGGSLDIKSVPLLNQAVSYSRLVYGSSGDTNNIDLSDLNTVLTSVEGIWVEGFKVAGSGSNKGYFDFYIRACWPNISGPVPNVIETVVRLYDFN